MSYQLTAGIIRDLKKHAKMLPYVPSGKKIRKLKFGHQLLAENPDVKTVNGKEIDPNHPYEFYENLPVDHFKNLKMVYVRDGLDGVKVYSETYRAVNMQLLTTKVKQAKRRKIFVVVGSILAIILFATAYYFWFL